jgi:LuxR family maltose regulon positive regulatory protein
VSTPLLETKLYAPPIRPELVSRPHLIERLEEGLRRGCKLTLLSAPAGYGKTTLLSAWAAHAESRMPVAWLSLDEGDNDPARFWAYVAGALRTVRAEIGEIGQMVFQSPPPPIDAALTGLLNQVAIVPDPFVLVLDDYHLIHTPAIHEGIAFLLEYLPPQMHLVMATRVDPPLPIPRLRGRGQLTELYQSDLRFTQEEAACFLNEAIGLDLSTEDVAALERRTEGWIAGLQMAAASMRRHDDAAGFIQAFAGTNRYILDYLVEEVLRQQPAIVRRFLLQTSVLDRLCGALCDAVTGMAGPDEGQPGTDAQSLLEQLERSNLFIVPLDDRRQWYRYHRLFGDLLRQRLQREQRDWVPELHRRASGWYEKNGLIPEAVSHAMSARDLARAADLVEQTAWAMLTRGESATLLGWLGALPAELIRSRPPLGVLRAWALALAGQLDDVESCLAGIDVEQVRGEAAAVRAYVAGVRGDVPRASALAQRASAHLPEGNLFLHVIVALNLGIAYWSSGDPAAASQALARAITLGRAAGQTSLTLFATAALGHVQEMRGLLREAVETHRGALGLLAEQGRRPVPFAGIAHVGIASVLYEWNDLAGAARYAAEGVRLSELGGRISFMLAGQVLSAHISQARGNPQKAFEIIQAAERLAQRHGHAYVLAEIAELRVRLWMAEENLVAASQWAHEHGASSTYEPRLALAREMEQLAVARVLIAEGEASEALGILGELLGSAKAAGRTRVVIWSLVLQVLAFRVQDDLDNALSILERALTLAEPEGYVRTFLDEGEPMKDLLSQVLVTQQNGRQAPSRDISPNYVARLLAAFGEEAELASPAMEALVEPLTEREVEVLRLVVAGLSNAEIAEELVIAVSTVKSHVNHIYGKLGVESRTQAVAQARTLGLL